MEVQNSVGVWVGYDRQSQCDLVYLGDGRPPKKVRSCIIDDFQLAAVNLSHDDAQSIGHSFEIDGWWNERDLDPPRNDGGNDKPGRPSGGGSADFDDLFKISHSERMRQEDKRLDPDYEPSGTEGQSANSSPAVFGQFRAGAAGMPQGASASSAPAGSRWEGPSVAPGSHGLTPRAAPAMPKIPENIPVFSPFPPSAKHSTGFPEARQPEEENEDVSLSSPWSTPSCTRDAKRNAPDQFSISTPKPRRDSPASIRMDSPSPSPWCPSELLVLAAGQAAVLGSSLQ